MRAMMAERGRNCPGTKSHIEGTSEHLGADLADRSRPLCHGHLVLPETPFFGTLLSLSRKLSFDVMETSQLTVRMQQVFDSERKSDHQATEPYPRSFCRVGRPLRERERQNTSDAAGCRAYEINPPVPDS